jgi:hypothetical protein
MSVLQTTIPGTAFNGSAISNDEGLRDNGSVDQEVVRILKHEVICGEFLPFFDRNGRIDTDMQICANVTATESDRILSIAFNKKTSEVKAEGVMGNDEHPHDFAGFKLLEDNMTVFFPSVGKTIPLTGIFRDDGHKLVILPDTQLTGLADVGEATKVGTIFRYLL